MIISIILNIGDWIGSLASHNPHGYIFTLAGYVIIFSVITYIIYRITYTPPEYENLVKNAQKKQDKLLDGLKTKINTIDTKQAKKKEKQAKKKKEVESKPANELGSKTNKRSVSKSSNFSTSSSLSSSKAKTKPVHRRR